MAYNTNGWNLGINPGGAPPAPSVAPASVQPIEDVGVPTGVPPPTTAMFGMPEPIPLPVQAVPVPEVVDPGPGEIEIEGEQVAAPPDPTTGLLEQPEPDPSAVTSAGIELDTSKISDLDAKRSRLDERAAELQEQFQATDDPTERAAIAERHRAVVTASEGLGAEQGDLRAGLAEKSAKLGAEAELAAGEAQRAADADKLRTSTEIQERFAVKEAERAEREQEARAQLDTDRSAYRELLQEGPKGVANFGLTLGEIFAETLRAQMKGEVPNYGPINQRMAQRNQAAFQQRAKQALAQVELSGDSVADEAHLQREIQAQEKAATAAAFEVIEQRLTERMGQLRDPLQRAQAAQAVEVVRVQRAQAEQAAQQARIDVELKRRGAQQKIALDEARTRKELALGGKAEAEAAKAARRGTGVRRPKISVERQLRGLDPKEAEKIKDRGLRDATGAFMGLAAGNAITANDKKEAKRLNDKLAKATTINGLLNRLTDIRNDAGREIKYWNSEETQAAEGALTELQLILKGKGFAELGVLAKADLDLIEKITGKDVLGFYSNLTRYSAMRDRLEDDINNDLMRSSNFSDLGKRFELPATAEFEPRRREQTVPLYREAYDRKSGTVVDADERMKTFAETLTATERQRDKREAWSQMHAEANSYVEQKGPETIREIKADIRNAKAAGDDARVTQLEEALDEEKAFIFDMKRERTRLRRGSKEAEDLKKAKAKAEKEFEETRATGKTFAGKV